MLNKYDFQKQFYCHSFSLLYIYTCIIYYYVIRMWNLIDKPSRCVANKCFLSSYRTIMSSFNIEIEIVKIV